MGIIMVLHLRNSFPIHWKVVIDDYAWRSTVLKMLLRARVNAFRTVEIHVKPSRRADHRLRSAFWWPFRRTVWRPLVSNIFIMIVATKALLVSFEHWSYTKDGTKVCRHAVDEFRATRNIYAPLTDHDSITPGRLHRNGNWIFPRIRWIVAQLSMGSMDGEQCSFYYFVHYI